MKKGTFLFLGTGSSAGVPMIGCQCEVCVSSLAANKRLRSSGLISIGGKQLLIDVGPEFRLQALHHGITHLDGVLLTHAHADHIGGLDDLRAFYLMTQTKMPCFLSQETLEEVRTRFHYFFAPISPKKSMAAQLDFCVLPRDFGSCEIAGIPLVYFSYFQLQTKVTGFRIGRFAYVSDIREYSEEVVKSLHGVEILVLSALRNTASPMHFTPEEAIAFSRKVGAERTFLTHLSHELEHETTNALLPRDVRLAYDGLEVEFTG